MKSLIIFRVFAISIVGIFISCNKVKVPPSVQQKGTQILEQKIAPQVERALGYVESSLQPTLNKAKNYANQRYTTTTTGTLSFETYSKQTLPFPSSKGTLYQRLGNPEISINDEQFSQGKVSNGEYQRAFNKYTLPIAKSAIDYTSTNKYVDNTSGYKLNSHLLRSLSKIPNAKYAPETVWNPHTKRFEIKTTYTASDVNVSRILSDMAKTGGTAGAGGYLWGKRKNK